jgi:membrane-associated phospholipid phosphatase
MAFSLVSLMLLVAHRRRMGSVTLAGTRLQSLEVVAFAAMTIAVACARVQLGYHSVVQVVAGTAIGSLFAFFWFEVTKAAVRAGLFLAVQRMLHPLGLHIRDTLHMADPHEVERHASERSL